MRPSRTSALAALAAVFALGWPVAPTFVVPAIASTSVTAPVLVDSGDDAAAWSAIASPNASARIVSGTGRSSSAFGLAFDLGRGRAHAIARRAVAIDLPADYMFVFTLKSDAEPNTVEIKFISGENVWWRRLADYEFPRDWKDLRVSKPRIAFAWGPMGGGMPVHLDAIEIAVVAGKGGRGEVWIDEIRLEPRDPDAAKRAPGVSTSSNASAAALLLDGDAATVWRSEAGEHETTITLDFHEAVEQGGLEIEHAVSADAAPAGFATEYVVEVSNDRSSWDEARRFTRSDGGVDHVYMPELYVRYVRLRFAAPPGRSVAVGEIRVQPYDFSATPNGFFTTIASSARPGLYPRYFLGEQSYWTVTGVSGDTAEALVNEEGSVEVDAGAFTLEPFVFEAGGLRTWKDTAQAVSLADGDLPIPTVERRDGDLSLAVTAFAAGKAGASTLYVRYRLKSAASESGSGAVSRQALGSRRSPARGSGSGTDFPKRKSEPDPRRKSETDPRRQSEPEAARHPGRRAVRLFVALRPFQVLPPWQALNRVGGVTPISRIVRDSATVAVDGRRVIALTTPDAFGAAAFEEGDITSFLLRGVVPPSDSVVDPFAHASAAMAWDVDLEPGAAHDIWIAVPWTSGSPVVAPSRDDNAHGVDAGLEALLESTRADWRARVARVAIELPASAKEWGDSLRSNLAYILINRDGAAIQPGSRTYERSWIRDGAMTSGALLELGLDGEVKEFLRWYAGFVGKDGWVPCCVDARGADPVPEHDSFGEFIWAVAEVWRFTRDEDFVREMWPHVSAAASCMSRLRATRMTPEYRGGAFYGLLPESISHEGYSARPVHSYWDQAFALRGFADAALLAEVVGHADSVEKFGAERDDFEKAWRESIRLTMEKYHLDVVPASVELGDFDPTSTAVAFLLGIEQVYPRDALERSFDKYVRDLRARSGLTTAGVGYTAYELRSATALVLLDRRAEAIELLETLVADERPAAWNQWPEISWLAPREPQFLGDIPHTWIGSTFVHAVRTLLVAEREALAPGTMPAATLVVGAGVPLAWFDGEGELRATSLPTWYGPLSLRMQPAPEKSGITVILQAGSPTQSRTAAGGKVRLFTIPEGGIQVVAPFGAEVASATIDGAPARVEKDSVLVRGLPATVIFQYKPRLENPR